MELSGGGLKRQHKKGTKLRHFSSLWRLVTWYGDRSTPTKFLLSECITELSLSGTNSSLLELWPRAECHHLCTPAGAATAGAAALHAVCSTQHLPAAVRCIVMAALTAAVCGKGFGNGRTRRHDRKQANQHGPMILAAAAAGRAPQEHRFVRSSAASLAGVCQRELLSPRCTLSNALDGIILVAGSRWPGMRIMTLAALQGKPQHDRGGGHRGCCQSR